MAGKELTSRYDRIEPIIEQNTATVTWNGEVDNVGKHLTTASQYSEWSDVIQNIYTGGSVSESTARSISTVWRCVALIAGGISTMPINFFERSGLGESKPIDHDYWYLLNRSPHPNYSAATFKESYIADMLLNGDGMAKIIRKSFRSNDIVNLEWTKSSNSYVYQDYEYGKLYYGLPNISATGIDVYTQEDVLHCPGAGFNGMRGMSAIQHALKSQINIATAAANHTEMFFKNGTRPEYAISYPATIKLTPEDAENIANRIAASHSGKNINKPMILNNGATISPVNLSQADAQLLESREFQVADIARFFGIPGHMVGTKDASVWGSGLEQQSIAYVTYTLLPIITKMEQEINRKFFPFGSKIYCKFDVSSLERGDYKSRMEAYRIGLGRAGEKPIYSVNEVRKKEGLMPVDGFDDLTPLMKKSQKTKKDTKI